MKATIIISVLIQVFSVVNLSAQKSGEEVYDSLFNSEQFVNGIRAFIEELGGVDTSYLQVTRNDTFMFGRLPEIFQNEGGQEVFACYEELVLDFFFIEFYPMSREKIWPYYDNLLTLEFDRIDFRTRTREDDGNIYEFYDFIQAGKKIRTIEIVYLRGVQLLGWEDIIWNE